MCWVPAWDEWTSVSLEYLPKKGIGVFGNIEARLAGANRCDDIIIRPYAPE